MHILNRRIKRLNVIYVSGNIPGGKAIENLCLEAVAMATETLQNGRLFLMNRELRFIELVCDINVLKLVPAAILKNLCCYGWCHSNRNLMPPWFVPREKIF